MTDSNGDEFIRLEVKGITTEEQIETLDFVLNNARDRTIPEELFYSSMIVETMIREGWRGDDTNIKYSAELNANSLNKLEYVKFLGKGGFSQVLLVKLKETGKLYGLKTVRKDLI